MLESHTRRGVRASWLVAICVSVGLTTTTTTSSAASVPCHPGCNIVGGYCGPSGGCRCRPGWTGALCDTRRPRPLSSSPTPGAHRCNTDSTTTTTTTTTTMTTSMGDQPLCPGHGSPCVAGGPGESGCPPREDPCSTPGSPREVTTSARGCQQPRVSPLTTFTSQTPSHQPPQQQQQQPPPQQQQQQQLLLQQQQQHQQQSQPHPHLQHSQQHHRRQQNERQLQYPRVEHRAAQQHLTPPLPLKSLGPPPPLLRRREVTMAQRRSTARVPAVAGFDSGSGSMSDWQRRWACVGALASFTSLVLLGSIALVFKPRWETWAANVRHRRLIERHRGRAARDGSTWHIEEEEEAAAAATPGGGKRADEGESARLLGSCA